MRMNYEENAKIFKALSDVQDKIVLHGYSGEESSVRMYDWNANKRYYTTPARRPSDDIIPCVQIDIQKKRLLVAGIRYPYRIVRIADGTEEMVHERKDSQGKCLVEITEKPGNDLLSLVKCVSAHWGPKDKNIITTDWTGAAKVYDASSGALNMTLPDAGHWAVLSRCKELIVFFNKKTGAVTTYRWPFLVRQPSQK